MYTWSEICVIKLIFLNSTEVFVPSQKQNLPYMKGKPTTEQLSEVAQLEKLPYFQNSEQINSSRQYSQAYFFPEGF